MYATPGVQKIAGRIHASLYVPQISRRGNGQEPKEQCLLNQELKRMNTALACLSGLSYTP